MNVRAFLVVPAVLAVGVLAGCGQTDGGAGAGAGSTQVKMSSTEVCHLPAYIRDRAPEGLCTETEVVDDDLSPTTGK
ncbi:hypothetical protein DCE93_12460 [Agromyces badenianii]|uniref:Uncharacterized protein n=1 Tax=Agromyces badenianii TaxID=2080742 RepID=A0A2S0WYL7_9MICO|nr:hypothetical protein [Agromyces badenianii]AWB96360.1 hypothetical protein DCE93_12460 [Agromyces badenianii]PWC05226.1 hypothetical protein DCE94_02700 [Agromyces badenianii]